MLAPRQYQWKPGILRYICPICPYDSGSSREVQDHIMVTHRGAAMPAPITMALSTVASPVPIPNAERVSCVMVTKDRREFVKASISYWTAQTYPNKELVIVDDGNDSVQDLVPSDVPDIQYIRVPKATVGEKRNIGARMATGALIAHWDDDEWQSPNRLVLQVLELQVGKLLLGIYRPIFGVLETRKLYIFAGPRSSSTYVSGSTLLYRKSLWDRSRYAAVNIGEDTMFIGNCPQRAIQQMEYSGFNVSFIHGGNTVSKQVTMYPYIELESEFPKDA